MKLIDTIFDFDDEIIIDESVQKYQYQQVPERGNNWTMNYGIPNGNTLNFDVNATDFVNLAQGYLNVQFTIQNQVNGVGAPAALTAANTGNIAAAFSNGFPLFETASLMYNNTPIEQLTIAAPYTVNIRNLLELSQSMSDSAMGDSMWYPDSGFGTAVSNQSTVVSYFVLPGALPAAASYAVASDVTLNPNYNKGFAKRLFYDQRVNDATGQLGPVGGITTQAIGGVEFGVNMTATIWNIRVPMSRLFGTLDWIDKAVKGGIYTVQLRYTSSLSRLWYTSGALAANANLVPVISNMWLYVPWVKPDPMTDASLTAKSVSGFVKEYMYEYASTQLCPYSTLSNNFTWQIGVPDARPTKVIITFQLASQTTGLIGNYSTYSSLVGPAVGAGGNNIIAPAQLSSMYLTYGGQTIPQQYFQPSLNGLDPCYKEYVKVCNRDNSTEDGPVISWSDYQNCMTLYVFDLRFIENSTLVSDQTSTLTLNLNISGGIPAGTLITTYATIFTQKTRKFTGSSGQIVMS
jgi:hypothetical protein